MRQGNLISWAIAALLAGLGQGCGSFEPPSKVVYLPDQKVTWVDSDATRRSAFLVPGKDGKPPIVIAAEPPPDAAMATAAALTGKLNYSGLSAEASANLTQSITQLGTRSESVMVLREGLYRIQQMVTDGQLTGDQAVPLFNQVLTAATTIAQADANNAKANLQNANAKVLDSLPAAEKGKLTAEKLEKMFAK